jgi:hypothetical protein
MYSDFALQNHRDTLVIEYRDLCMKDVIEVPKE